MTRTRTAIPAPVKAKVLEEFNHKCAICGKERPQIHHINGNPSDHRLENLIPLCPNSHLIDLHNPTEPINPKIVGLFRIYKDPTILTSEFIPLYKRFEFLYDIQDNSTLEDLKRPTTKDLINFVQMLNMGGYYYSRISQEIGPKPQTSPPYISDNPESIKANADYQREFQSWLCDSITGKCKNG